MHSHPIRQLTNIERRKFLEFSALALTTIALSNLQDTAAASTIKLPGFSAFSKKVKIFKNSKYYLVESDGMPDHGMMIGIKSWQQQIPTPQPYGGGNSWSIPIKPTLSKNPISTQGHFLRGAIAIAVNGVPIFNALNNRGEDAFLVGELDDWGGHCGRADDYHYHAAPFHLQSITGTKVPIAYALDGFPIYGETEIDGKLAKNLDKFNGHFDSKNRYHYHGTKTFPYINGGFRGVVEEVEGQVSPQANSRNFRTAGTPLRGATIIGFDRIGSNRYSLSYQLDGEVYRIDYMASLTEVEINYTNPDGTTYREVYRR